MEKKTHMKFILILISIFLLSTLLLMLIGEPPKSILVIILSGMAFAPLEIYATVFFLESFLKRREEKENEFREDAEYFSIAEEEQKQLIWLIKHNLGDVFNKNSQKKTGENFSYVCANENHVIDHKLINESTVEKHLFEEFETVGVVIKKEILDFYSVYLKFIPLDIFKELHGIYQIIEISLLFSDNPYLFQEKETIVLKYRNNQFTQEDYQRLIELSIKQLKEINHHISNIEKMTIEHYNRTL
ncbi:hypothetical protein [uncultured Vagococcus sp.]|uniref:hypothetical protein n=1 Tax=uncultured Vagococcus sp. TaxID=189676 RepID=UPI0028D7787C|nr:hypothetical protein [uncultured Vagococcus sp.]